jgi:hypothetical protein
MDIETQLTFIKTEKQKHQDAITTLDAIEATLTDKVSAQLASLPSLIQANEVLTIEKTALEDEKAILIKQNSDLLIENEGLKVQPVDEILSDKTVM